MLPRLSEQRTTWDGGSVAVLDQPETSVGQTRDWSEAPKSPPRFELAIVDVIDEVRSRMTVRGYRWD